LQARSRAVPLEKNLNSCLEHMPRVRSYPWNPLRRQRLTRQVTLGL
jgi:hypothetical protein